MEKENKKITQEEIKAIEEKAKKIRKGIIEEVYSHQSGHPGGSLSATDIMTVLFFKEMNIDPNNEKDPNRDRFVLSKGHAAPVLYSALARRGFFDPKELLARVKAVTRRYAVDNQSKDVIKYSDLTIDIGAYEVTYKGKNVKLAPKELELLHFMANNPNKVFTREQLMYEVWGYDYPGDSRTVDVHIKRLREKLKGGETWEVQTVWGVGYKFEVK